MNTGEMMAWQWRTYPDNHRDRTNLIIHIVAVPLFLLGNLGVIGALALLSIPVGATGLTLMILAMALQWRGYSLERVPPQPFSGAANALGRVFLEQWYTFPHFVLSGRWHRALRAAGTVDAATPRG